MNDTFQYQVDDTKKVFEGRGFSALYKTAYTYTVRRDSLSNCKLVRVVAVAVAPLKGMATLWGW